MTLEKSAPPLGFTGDSLITNSPSHKTKYFTLPHSPKYPEPVSETRFIKDGLKVTGHRVLNRTASDNTFLTRSPGLDWASVDNGDYIKERKSSFKKRYTCALDVNFSRNSSNNPAGRHERMVRNLSVKEVSSVESKKHSSSSGATSVEHVPRPQTGQSIAQSQHSICPGEVLLDFPCSQERSSVLSAGKRTDKPTVIKSGRAHRSLRHSQSMPGLNDEFIKDGRFMPTGTKPESKTHPFFLFFRKKLAGTDRSSSPCTLQNIRRCPSNPRSIVPPVPKSDRQSSPPLKDYRSPAQSLISSKLYQNSFSSNVPVTPRSSMSLTSPTVSTSNSPTSTDKLPQYTTRSRSKCRRESGRSKSKRGHGTRPDDGLTLEDLPPHPSLYKKTAERTHSYPISPPVQQSSSRVNNHKIEAPSKVDSGPRRNSMPVSSLQEKDAVEGSETDQSTHDSKENYWQNLRKKSTGGSDKTSTQESSNCEVTNSKSNHQRKPLLRSKSVPTFESDIYLPNTDIRVISDADDFEYKPTDMTGSLNLSLCGCGFLGMYHLGVVSCLAQRGPSFLDRVEKVGGASAGAIMAAVLITARDKIEESAEHIQNLAKEIRRKPLGPLTPGYNFTRSLRCMLDDILPQDAHEAAQGKLCVSVTNADTKKSEMLTDFKSRDELIEALVASCYIPIYAGIRLPTIRGKKYIDGGLSNNLPKFETGRTITVSPFDGKSDIGPKVGQEAEKKAHFINVQNQDVQVNANNIRKGAQAFFPPKRQSLQDFFEKGRYDANRFLIREGLYQITPPQQLKAVLYESSV